MRMAYVLPNTCTLGNQKEILFALGADYKMGGASPAYGF